ncbi:TIR domain-containing protein [Nostoc sp.]|uniref:TIR domain-containing protein n=1 Tax=Nostoc sp. TaxID=1180 RepID=UPI002FF78FE9
MENKHSVFLSYYHNRDECWRQYFEQLFGNLFINKSVKIGDISKKLNAQSVREYIYNNYIFGVSILVVLVGEKTYCRKHIDWEISGALMQNTGNASGLVGLCLPTHPNYKQGHYNFDIIPPRLVDNIKSGYAQIYDWTEDENTVAKWIEEAAKLRINQRHFINNSRPLIKRNRCK